MKIAYICISHKAITKNTVGGIETFSVYLINSLKRLGCDITLFSAEETDMSLFPGVKNIPTFSTDDLEKKESENTESKEFTLNYAMFQYAGLLRALNLSGDFDLIHFNCAQWYVPFLVRKAGFNRVVTTTHVNNLKDKPISYVLNNFPGIYIANISQTMHEKFSYYQKAKTVYNGIDLSGFTYDSGKGNYFCWLGRIAPVKGLKEAIIAAKKADVEFIASGSIDYADYFKTEIAPLLDEKRTVIGPLDPEKKGEFLGKAAACLLPINWDEPFGLVAVESMACGTPVIAYKRGGLRETVIDGKTGFLVTGIEEMTDKIKKIDTIDRSFCRKHVENNFSSAVMAENYLNYYNEILEKELHNS